jgi:hypothetical protein
MTSVKRLLVVCLLALALPATALAWGGSYPTGDAFGSSVHIDVSDSYPVDQTLPQTWATYLGTLVHGPEISKLILHLAPLPEVQATCGSSALACYDPGSETILASPDDTLDEPPAKEVVAHEYGHHIANNRLDNPLSAEDYGTKRWASYENICARSASGELSPGNEGVSYTENPGEAFAESYRVLNLTKEGQTSISWDIVDDSLYPDATALSLLEQDVVSPWTGPTLTHVRGSFGNGVTRTIGLKTTLDGTLVARLHAPSKGAAFRLSLWNGSRLVERNLSTVRWQICGQRALTLKVERLRGRGAFTVDISKP